MPRQRSFPDVLNAKFEEDNLIPEGVRVYDTFEGYPGEFWGQVAYRKKSSSSGPNTYLVQFDDGDTIEYDERAAKALVQKSQLKVGLGNQELEKDNVSNCALGEYRLPDDIGKHSGECNISKQPERPSQTDQAEGKSSLLHPIALFSVGELVKVDPRREPGVNKPGGIGRIKKIVFMGGDAAEVSYDVKYVMGGWEKKVDEARVSPCNGLMIASTPSSHVQSGDVGNEADVHGGEQQDTIAVNTSQKSASNAESQPSSTAQPLPGGASSSGQPPSADATKKNSITSSEKRSSSTMEPCSLDVTLRWGDMHNDLCEVCSLGGKVLCCDTCTLVFHLKCVRPKMKAPPPDTAKWYCAFCVIDGCASPSDGDVTLGPDGISGASAAAKTQDSSRDSSGTAKSVSPAASQESQSESTWHPSVGNSAVNVGGSTKEEREARMRAVAEAKVHVKQMRQLATILTKKNSRALKTRRGRPPKGADMTKRKKKEGVTKKYKAMRAARLATTTTTGEAVAAANVKTRKMLPSSESTPALVVSSKRDNVLDAETAGTGTEGPSGVPVEGCGTEKFSGEQRRTLEGQGHFSLSPGQHDEDKEDDSEDKGMRELSEQQKARTADEEESDGDDGDDEDDDGSSGEGVGDDHDDDNDGDEGEHIEEEEEVEAFATDSCEASSASVRPRTALRSCGGGTGVSSSSSSTSSSHPRRRRLRKGWAWVPEGNDGRDEEHEDVEKGVGNEEEEQEEEDDDEAEEAHSSAQLRDVHRNEKKDVEEDVATTVINHRQSDDDDDDGDICDDPSNASDVGGSCCGYGGPDGGGQRVRVRKLSAWEAQLAMLQPNSRREARLAVATSEEQQRQAAELLCRRGEWVCDRCTLANPKAKSLCGACKLGRRPSFVSGSRKQNSRQGGFLSVGTTVAASYDDPFLFTARGSTGEKAATARASSSDRNVTTAVAAASGRRSGGRSRAGQADDFSTEVAVEVGGEEAGTAAAAAAAVDAASSSASATGDQGRPRRVSFVAASLALHDTFEPPSPFSAAPGASFPCSKPSPRSSSSFSSTSAAARSLATSPRNNHTSARKAATGSAALKRPSCTSSSSSSSSSPTTYRGWTPCPGCRSRNKNRHELHLPDCSKRAHHEEEESANLSEQEEQMPAPPSPTAKRQKKNVEVVDGFKIAAFTRCHVAQPHHSGSGPGLLGRPFLHKLFLPPSSGRSFGATAAEATVVPDDDGDGGPRSKATRSVIMEAFSGSLGEWRKGAREWRACRRRSGKVTTSSASSSTAGARRPSVPLSHPLAVPLTSDQLVEAHSHQRLKAQRVSFWKEESEGEEEGGGGGGGARASRVDLVASGQSDESLVEAPSTAGATSPQETSRPSLTLTISFNDDSTQGLLTSPVAPCDTVVAPQSNPAPTALTSDPPHSSPPVDCSRLGGPSDRSPPCSPDLPSTPSAPTSSCSFDPLPAEDMFSPLVVVDPGTVFESTGKKLPNHRSGLTTSDGPNGDNSLVTTARNPSVRDEVTRANDGTSMEQFKHLKEAQGMKVAVPSTQVGASIVELTPPNEGTRPLEATKETQTTEALACGHGSMSVVAPSRTVGPDLKDIDQLSSQLKCEPEKAPESDRSEEVGRKAASDHREVDMDTLDEDDVPPPAPKTFQRLQTTIPAPFVAPRALEKAALLVPTRVVKPPRRPLPPGPRLGLPPPPGPRLGFHPSSRPRFGLPPRPRPPLPPNPPPPRPLAPPHFAPPPPPPGAPPPTSTRNAPPLPPYRAPSSGTQSAANLTSFPVRPSIAWVGVPTPAKQAPSPSYAINGTRRWHMNRPEGRNAPAPLAGALDGFRW